MSIRTGSLRGMEELDTLEVKALLEDYALAKRRDHCSRQDFAAGWRAAKLRFAEEHGRFEDELAEETYLRIAV